MIENDGESVHARCFLAAGFEGNIGCRGCALRSKAATGPHNAIHR